MEIPRLVQAYLYGLGCTTVTILIGGWFAKYLLLSKGITLHWPDELAAMSAIAVMAMIGIARKKKPDEE